jgi:hypothetical protein
MMKHTVSLLAILMMLAMPAALAGPIPAEAAESPITIFAEERGSSRPARYACYTLTVQGQGGRGAGCDDGLNGDVADGKVVITPTGECSPCIVTQSLPDKPDDSRTDYLPEDPQVTQPGGTVTFRNFLKPYIVVTIIDAKTGKPVKGACIGAGPEGEVFSLAACDGNANGGDADQDGKTNGKIKTRRLDKPGIYTVANTFVPAGYRKAKSVTLSAEPAKTGEFEQHTFKLRRLR